MKHKNKTYTLIFLPFTLVFLLLLFYFFYWKISGEKIKNAIIAHKGNVISFDKIENSGFPYRQSIIFENFHIKKNDNKFEAKELEITSSPFNPKLWVFTNAIEPKFKNKNIKLENFQASIRFNVSKNLPKIARFSLIADEIQIFDNEKNDIISNLKFHIFGDEKNNYYAFSIEANGLEKIEPFKSRKISPEILRGIVNDAKTIDNGFENWRKNNGNIEIKYGRIAIGNIGPIEYGTFDKLNGKLKINENGAFDGNLISEGDLTIFSNNKIAISNLNLIIKDSQVNFEQTIQSAISRQFLNGNVK